MVKEREGERRLGLAMPYLLFVCAEMMVVGTSHFVGVATMVARLELQKIKDQ
ncbi:hypothetical protein SODALDRAFT_359181 [Sodiomyces alkalinus F11]|uniref:Uncharacterized protein n=1 Tax=Sodiomyces alkalinus (strain CBS 110278 / VKM F-3762 / F11) TaxID=1314773 RepID=A0A3N2PXP1_SODAK|nr:hypothetical protein SODALDRAFT_359181 [Sodiomyces alkalinus F11]ROT39300.1 hypothetical protein SODALDRAFT_359181 [Sodiomyces alkalinus F11]